MCSMKNAVVRARIDMDLKSEAEAVLKANDLEVSDAIRLFLRQVVRSGGLPFSVRNPGFRVASGKRLWAMKRDSQERDHQLVARGDVPPESVMLLRPKRLKGYQVQWQDAPLIDDYAPA
jgi:DNA-damage-inducible protein J